MEGRNTLFALLDADNTIYNFLYKLLLLFIIVHHGVFIKTYANIKEKTEEDKNNIKKLIDTIIKQFSEMISYESGSNKPNIKSSTLSYTLLTALILQNGKFQIEKDGKSECNAFINEKLLEYLEYIKQLGEDGERLSEALLYHANRPLFSLLANRVKTEKFTKLVFISLSNRQTDSLEQHNSKLHGTGLFCNDIYLIKNIAKKELQGTACECMVDDFTMQKVYGKDKYIFDDYKITPHYAVFNHIAKEYPGDKSIASFEDRDVIRDSVIQFFLTDLELMPPIDVEFWRYDGVLPKNRHFTIVTADLLKEIDIEEIPIYPGSHHAVFALRGNGIIDSKYPSNIKRLLTLCDHDPEDYKNGINFKAVFSKSLLEQFKLGRVLRDYAKETSYVFSIFNPNIPKENTDTQTIVTPHLLRTSALEK